MLVGQASGTTDAQAKTIDKEGDVVLLHPETETKPPSALSIQFMGYVFIVIFLSVLLSPF